MIMMTCALFPFFFDDVNCDAGARHQLFSLQRHHAPSYKPGVESVEALQGFAVDGRIL